jgi:hypothetical protein
LVSYDSLIARLSQTEATTLNGEPYREAV